MAKTVVVGLDSIDWRLLSKAINEGRTPNIENIKDNGFHGKLRSVDPPLSVPAWLCFSTGKRPDKLDIYDFKVLEPGSYNLDKLGSLSEYQEEVFWKDLDAGAIGVPSIYPTEDYDFEGFVAPGPFTPGGSYPESFADEVEEFGYTASTPNFWKFEESLQRMDDEGDFISQVLDRRSPEFFIGVTSITDRLQHSYRNDEEKMMELYNEADEFVGKILQYFNEDDNVFIVSDHGTSEIKKIFYINTWLRDEGLLKFNKKGNYRSRVREQLRYIIKNIAKNLLSKLSLLDLALDNIPDTVQSGIRDKSKIWDKIDWSNSRAFATGGYVGQIYINTEEYPKGCVTEEEYEDVRNEIIRKLRDLEDPETGEKVVDEVWRKEELYREELADRAPDIMFYPKDMAYKVNDGFHGKVFDESVPNGSHGLNGVILGRGPDIRSGEFDMNLVDVAPTLLHLMGERVPEDMDGEVKKQIFEPDSDPRQREVQRYSSEIEEIDF